MSMKYRAALICLALLPALVHADEKDAVHRKASATVIEDVLDDLGIRHKKTAQGQVTTYDFERKGFKIRLSNFGGNDLMLDALFKAVSVERINAWNVRAKFSRGVVYPGEGKPYTALESNLDCTGGVTTSAIKQFLRRFETEVKTFAEFLGNTEETTPAPSKADEDTLYLKATEALIVKVLKDLNLRYQREAFNDGNVAYVYERNNLPIRLINYGGKDLMLTAEFRKTTLKEANSYNLKRKLVRAVFYQNDGRQYTALERNLDAEAGVTEGILRNFITSYEQDVKEFQLFLEKNPKQKNDGQKK